MSDLPYEDRQRLIKSTFAEMFRENASDPQFIRGIRDALRELDKAEPSTEPQSQPSPSTQHHPSNGGMQQRVSAFEKFLLGR